MPVRTEVTERVRARYERHPYPPVSWLALPRKGQGAGLFLDQVSPGATEGARILVAGAGTLEPLVVAAQHPRARAVVAVDLSAASIAQLRRRLLLARPLRRMAKLETVSCDLWEYEPTAPFDYVIATHVLQHTDSPAGLLARLASFLRPGGILRVVTYPKGSRLWMRHTARFFAHRGLTADTPNLVARARELVMRLSEGDPIRSTFLANPESRALASLVDAFFHPCERPLSPLEWQFASEQSGLSLLAEGQTETSRSTFLDELLPPLRMLSVWQKLQILDDVLELCANPILWFRKDREPLGPPGSEPDYDAPSGDYYSGWRTELRSQLERARELVSVAGISLDELMSELREQVGPRELDGKILPSLSVGEYDIDRVLSTTARGLPLEFARERLGFST